MNGVRLEALADGNRWAIVQLLSKGKCSVCEPAVDLGQSEALISHHVKRLRTAGFVRTRKVGRWLHCRLDVAGIRELAMEFLYLAQAADAAAARVGECDLAARESKGASCA